MSSHGELHQGGSVRFLLQRELGLRLLRLVLTSMAIELYCAWSRWLCEILASGQYGCWSLFQINALPQNWHSISLLCSMSEVGAILQAIDSCFGESSGYGNAGTNFGAWNALIPGDARLCTEKWGTVGRFGRPRANHQVGLYTDPIGSLLGQIWVLKLNPSTH